MNFSLNLPIEIFLPNPQIISSGMQPPWNKQAPSHATASSQNVVFSLYRIG